MPNANPIIRSMDWGICLKILPEEISKHLPEGDPLENKEEINNEIKSMQKLGPKGKVITNKFIDGKIEYDEMIKRLNNLKSEINEDELEQFNRNMWKIIDETNKSGLRCFIPFVSAGVDVDQVKDVASEVSALDIYDTNIDNKNLDKCDNSYKT